MRPDHAVAAAGQGPDRGAPRALCRLTTESVKRSFPPIVDARARLLVLGTLPGEESLRRGEYYAHPRNLFWPIVFALVGETPPLLYADKVRLIQERRFAVWDVCASARRVASADTSIAGEMPNAIDALLDAHSGIGAVAFNGIGAQRLYGRHFPRRPELRYFALPSTSPAHARLRFHDKLARWNVLREVLIG